MKVRTRIAPSPTGAPHIGTAYIALFNYAFAKRHGGDFLLRIEDTDQARSTASSEQAILEALRWMGLPWDEGPDVGGPKGPYRQSERTGIYRTHVQELVAAGRAYPCFCSSERLRALRESQEAEKGPIGYDGLCSGLPPQEAQARVEAGEAHVVRLRTPAEGTCAFTDTFRGEIRIDWSTIDDQILLKADGFPTYHLANVVDDHLMEITHVIRGEEWISSTPKHVLLYEAFGWRPPLFAHLPLLRNPDKSKLSKRKNPTGILYYRQAGFLAEALLNFLGLMAYRPEGEEEIFDLEAMVAGFDLARVSLGAPIFDLQKLTAFNGHYIRELSGEALLARMKAWMLNDGKLLPIVTMAQPRLETLSDFIPMSSYLFADRLDWDVAGIGQMLDPPERVPALIQITQWEFEVEPCWDAASIRAVFTRIADIEGIPFKSLLRIFFEVVSGRAVALPLFETMEWLGRELSVRRMQYVQALLQEAGVGLSGKAAKRLAKDYESRYGRER